METRLKAGLAATLLPLNTLLAFLLLFEGRLHLPGWLQVLGRMHPLVLHFPIVLLCLYVVLAIAALRRPLSSAWQELREWLLLSAAVTASATAIMGLFLAQEPGYDAEAIGFHKWSAVLLVGLLNIVYVFRKSFTANRMISAAASVLMLVTVVLAGHEGAGITHGDSFLLEPVMAARQKPKIPLAEVDVYKHMVRPILEAKCLNCHNPRKAKGELLMNDEAGLLKGGKDGVLWDTTAADLGLMLRRLHLPMEEKKHMPPRGKPQLSGEELEIIAEWIKKGSPFRLMLADLPPGDTLHALATAVLEPVKESVYTFAAAPEKTVQELSNGNRVVYPVAIESPALNVDFYNRENFSSESLKQLEPLREQIVSVNLAHMPVKDADLAFLARLPHLETLNLNFTQITGAGLPALKSLSELHSLSLSGNSLTLADLQVLKQFPKLKEAFVWSTGLSEDEKAQLAGVKGKLRFETGFNADTLLMQLTPPLLENETPLVHGKTALKLKHYIQGAVIHYTLDGSDPDSIKSPVYDGQLTVTHNVLLKARAFKTGWQGSATLQKFFFAYTFVPDSAWLRQPADPKYSGQGAATLTDHEKGDLNFANGQWLGFRNNAAELEFYFNRAVHAGNVTLSLLQNVGGYIMPPQEVEIWGGIQAEQLRLLGRVRPQQPGKDGITANIPVEINFTPTAVQYLRVKVVPVQKLPAWHPGKGEKGWVFMDEVMVN